LARGGAVAGGCMFAFAHDYVYAAGKALFCTNESQNQMSFPPGMMTVIKKRHAYAGTIRDMVILSKQFSAEMALEGKLIDGIWSE
jgi:enoyl-CoA hydratase/carnithine racemase